MRNISIPSTSMLHSSINQLDALINGYDSPQGITLEVQQCMIDIKMFAMELELALVDVDANVKYLDGKLNTLEGQLDNKVSRVSEPPPSQKPLHEMPYFTGTAD